MLKIVPQMQINRQSKKESLEYHVTDIIFAQT